MSGTFSEQLSTAAVELTGDYTIDPAHSRLGFVARHAMVTKVRGGFADFAGTIHLDAADPSRSSATVTIQAGSFTSNNEQRDSHVNSADFLDVANFPTITFVSTAAEALGEESYRLTGDLTIRGVTRPVTIDFEFSGSAKDPFGNVRAGFEGKTTLSRKDWGLVWNAALETGGVLVSDKVVLELDIAAVKA